jgi:hypothetical protein
MLVFESMGLVIVNELILSPSLLNVSDENSRKPNISFRSEARNHNDRKKIQDISRWLI